MNIFGYFKIKRFIGLILICLLICGCSRKKKFNFNGNTMGTTWAVSIVCEKNPVVINLGKAIQDRLNAINSEMSLFDKKSYLTKINNAEQGQPIPLSEGFLTIFKMADDLYSATKGKWDCTIGPLTELWGFGDKGRIDNPPSESEIKSCLSKTGYNNLKIDYKNKTLTKKRSDLVIDLGSIAKGYAVDDISRLIKGEGFNDFIVEIGGEVYTSGNRIDGSKWRVGINRPLKHAKKFDLYKIIEISDFAVATSGDYRNFFENKGRQYSHIIDPVSGKPVSGEVTAVTIISRNTAMADGLATAIMIMGCEEGINLIESLKETEAMILVRKDGKITSCISSGWEQLR